MRAGHYSTPNAHRRARKIKPREHYILCCSVQRIMHRGALRQVEKQAVLRIGKRVDKLDVQDNTALARATNASSTVSAALPIIGFSVRPSRPPNS